MNTEKGFAHFVVLLLIIVLVAAAYFLISKGIIKTPNLPFLKKEPTVEVKKVYQNPFKKETQYVNPFETYKNPFVLSK